MAKIYLGDVELVGEDSSKVSTEVVDTDREAKVTNAVTGGGVQIENKTLGKQVFVGVNGEPATSPPVWEASNYDSGSQAGTLLLGTESAVYYGKPGELIDLTDSVAAEKKELARVEDLEPVFLTEAEYAALEDPPGSGLYPTLRGRTVSLVDVDTGEQAFEIGQPDYANMETVNRITSNNGTWTADRTGYVSFYCNSLGSSTESWISVKFAINNKSVGGGTTYCPVGAAHDETAIAMVRAGDVVKIVANGEVQNVNCFFIPPKLVSIAQPKVSEDFLNVAMVPDWSNIEAVNRIPAASLSSNTNSKFGSWTADRTGYVKCVLYALSDMAHVSLVISINGQYMYVSGKDGPVSMTSYYATTVPVKVGDQITFIFGSGENANITVSQSGCYFIPPKFVTTQAPNIIIGGPSYSTVEQATGEHWIDGKPIYRKQFTSNVTIQTQVNFSNIIFYNGVTGDRLIKFDGLKFIPASGLAYANWELEMPVVYGGSSIQSMIHNTSKHVAYISGIWGSAPTSGGPDFVCAITGVAYYTKG
jgi:hypothetical protein